MNETSKTDFSACKTTPWSSEMMICLADSPTECRYAKAYLKTFFCTHPDRMKFLVGPEYKTLPER